LARQIQRVPLPHNSIFVLGFRTNAKWLHGIRPDKRREAEKSDAERAFGGERISITFRNIGTYMSADKSKIWGQGAVSKYQATAGSVNTSDGGQLDAMIFAFGKENQQSEFDWDAEYGRGFDVLNLSFAKSTLYLCGDEVANLRVKMCVLGSGLDCRITRGRPDTPDKRQAMSSSRRTIFALSGDDAPLLREADPACSEISGDLAILFYLNKLYPSSLEGATATPSAAPPTVGARPVGSVGGSSGPTSTKKPNTIQHGREPSTASMRERQRLASNIFARITQANELLFLWQELRGGPLTASTRSTHQVRRLSPEQRAAELSSAAALLQLQLQQRQQPSPQQDTTSATATTTIPRTKPSVSDSTSTTATATAAASSAAASAAAAQQIASSSSSHNSSIQRGGGTETAPAPAAPNTTRALEVEAFEGELEVWEEYAEQSEYIAGDVYAVVDCAFWPVLNEIVRRWEGWSERKYPHLADYWRKVGAMGSTRAALMVGRD
jgi:glutathione S-transferase